MNHIWNWNKAESSASHKNALTQKNIQVFAPIAREWEFGTDLCPGKTPEPKNVLEIFHTWAFLLLL